MGLASPVFDCVCVQPGVGQMPWATCPKRKAQEQHTPMLRVHQTDAKLPLQNIGGGLPRDMDKATQGRPGKRAFCCAENEAANPGEPLHVERGHAREDSTVTVVGALGTWNMNITAREPENVIAMIGDTMQYPARQQAAYAGRAAEAAAGQPRLSTRARRPGRCALW